MNCRTRWDGSYCSPTYGESPKPLKRAPKPTGLVAIFGLPGYGSHRMRTLLLWQAWKYFSL